MQLTSNGNSRHDAPRVHAALELLFPKLPPTPRASAGVNQKVNLPVETESQKSSSLSYQEACFTCFEGCIVCHISHNPAFADQIEAVADGSTLLEAVGPPHSAPLQRPKFAINYRQHALQLWLQDTQGRSAIIHTCPEDAWCV